MSRTAHIIGANFGHGQERKGVDTGPEVLMRANGGTPLVEQLQGIGFDDVVVDNLQFYFSKEQKGAKGFSPGVGEEMVRAKNVSVVGSSTRKIHEAVYSGLKAGNFVITLGGDHSIAIGTLSAALRAYPDMCCIWVSAHADINTPSASVSGNMHGMPLSFLMNMFDSSSYPNFSWFKEYLQPSKTSPMEPVGSLESSSPSPSTPSSSSGLRSALLSSGVSSSAPAPLSSSPAMHAVGSPTKSMLSLRLSDSPVPGDIRSPKNKKLPTVQEVPERLALRPDRIAYIGLRDLDEAEKDVIKRLHIPSFTISDIEKLGIHKVLEAAMNQINPGRNLPVHLSFNIDALDPLYAPATGTTSPGGLTLREGRTIAEFLAQSGLLTSVDLVEVNPSLSDAAGVAVTVRSALEILLSACGRRFL